MPDVVITTGVDSTGFKTGMAEVRNYAKEGFADIKSQFAGLIAVGSIIEAGKTVIEYGSRVQDLSERFGVATKAIQEFGNVAEQQGSSLESVAAGFNKLEISQDRALKGNKDLLAAFENLGVSAQDLATLKPEEIAIKIGHSSMDAADMVAIFGRNALEIVPTFRAIADGSVPLGKAIDDNIIKKLDAADDAIKQFAQTARVEFAEAIAGFIDTGKFIKDYLAFFNQTGGFGDFKKFQGSRNPPASTPPGSPREAPSPDSSSSSSSSSSGLQDRINALQEEHDARQRTNEQQLNYLLERRSQLFRDHEQALVDEYDGTVKVGTAQKILVDRMENEKAIDEINAKIGKEKLDTQKQITTEREKANAEFEKEAQHQADLIIAGRAAAADAQERNLELDAQLSGHEDIAAQLKIEYDYDKLINQAYADGNTELANQLETQKALTQEMAAQIAAEKARRQEERNAQIEADNAKKISDAAARKFYSPGGGIEVAYGLALDPRTGKVDPLVLARERAKAERDFLLGRNATFLPAAQANRNITDNFYREYYQQQRTAAASQQQQLVLLQQAYNAPTLTVLNQILAQLQQTHGIIYPPPG